jgi:hypothetical protein
MIKVKYERKFQIWFYTVSHAQIILRCVKDGAHDSQVDFLFKNVHFINSPAYGDNIEISEAGSDEAMRVNEEHEIPDYLNARVFILKSGNLSGYIIAGHFECVESNADFYEESALLVGPYLGKRSRGLFGHIRGIFGNRRKANK